MFRNQQNKFEKKIARGAVTTYHSLMIKDARSLKPSDNYYSQIPNDNFFTCLPKDLRLQCCPEDKKWIHAVTHSTSNELESLMQFRRLRDRLSLSSTCKSLRDTLWLDDPNLRAYIHNNKKNHSPAVIAGERVEFVRGVGNNESVVDLSSYASSFSNRENYLTQYKDSIQDKKENCCIQ